MKKEIKEIGISFLIALVGTIVLAGIWGGISSLLEKEEFTGTVTLYGARDEDGWFGWKDGRHETLLLESKADNLKKLLGSYGYEDFDIYRITFPAKFEIVNND